VLDRAVNDWQLPQHRRGLPGRVAWVCDVGRQRSIPSDREQILEQQLAIVKNAVFAKAKRRQDARSQKRWLCAVAKLRASLASRVPISRNHGRRCGRDFKNLGSSGPLLLGWSLEV
jgi:hypothetical protein